MRKLHLTLPTRRDVAARNLEMKLVQSSPEMTLAEGLSLFQEVQDWLETEPQEEVCHHSLVGMNKGLIEEQVPCPESFRSCIVWFS